MTEPEHPHPADQAVALLVNSQWWVLRFDFKEHQRETRSSFVEWLANHLQMAKSSGRMIVSHNGVDEPDRITMVALDGTVVAQPLKPWADYEVEARAKRAEQAAQEEALKKAQSAAGGPLIQLPGMVGKPIGRRPIR